MVSKLRVSQYFRTCLLLSFIHQLHQPRRSHSYLPLGSISLGKISSKSLFLSSLPLPNAVLIVGLAFVSPTNGE